MQRQIKFTSSGHSHSFGNFVAGDVLRCPADAAKHFVEDAQAAVYDDVAPVPPVAANDEAVTNSPDIEKQEPPAADVEATEPEPAEAPKKAPAPHAKHKAKR